MNFSEFGNWSNQFTDWDQFTDWSKFTDWSNQSRFCLTSIFASTLKLDHDRRIRST